MTCQELNEQINNKFAEVAIDDIYENHRLVKHLQMKEAEKACLELALERLNKEMVTKDFNLERKKHELLSQHADYNTIKRDMIARCEQLDK